MNHTKNMIRAIVNGDEAAAAEHLKSHLSERMKAMLEANITSGNVHQLAGLEVSNLTGTDQFKLLQGLDADYAKKLENSWSGDAASYKRSKGKGFESLVRAMLSSKYVETKTKVGRITPEIAQALQLLQSLQIHSFPPEAEAKKIDTSVWSHEKVVKEEAFDEEMYESMKSELLTESTVSKERIDQLKKLGFYVENMDKHGEDFAGQWRWLRKNSDDFQDGGTSDSEAEAWESCDRFAKEYVTEGKRPASEVVPEFKNAVKEKYPEATFAYAGTMMVAMVDDDQVGVYDGKTREYEVFAKPHRARS